MLRPLTSHSKLEKKNSGALDLKRSHTPNNLNSHKLRNNQ